MYCSFHFRIFITFFFIYLNPQKRIQVLQKGAEVKMKLQDLKLLIKNTSKQKGTIHSKLHLYKNKKKSILHHITTLPSK